MVHIPIRPIACRLLVFASVCAIGSAAWTAAAHAAPAVSACAGATDLHLRIADQGHGPAGVTYYTLDFTNTSRSTCSLSGVPYVSMVTKSGGQLGSPAVRPRMLVIPLVILAPGATAHTTLAYQGGNVTSRHGCGPVTKAVNLRAYVAGQKLALLAPLGLHACSRSGQVYLAITGPFRAGMG